MPHRVWSHECTVDGNGLTHGGPTCDRCGKEGRFEGWSYGMHEDMGRYQTLYRLKPIGPHRPMANELFRDLTVRCGRCHGRGLLDHRGRCACCPDCKGLARHFTVPGEVVESIRAEILREHPDAGAEPVQNFPYAVMIHDLARGVIIGAPRDEPKGASGTGAESPGASSEDMHLGYFTTHFRDYDEIGDWPEEFVILSAYATTGETWTDDENEQAHEKLQRALSELGVWTHFILGFSTESDHAEPSWAADLPLHEARALGRRFHQDAIFHVCGDRLSVTRCDEEAPLVPVGSFRERLHLGSGR